MRRFIVLLLAMIVFPLFAGAQSANNFDKVWVQGAPMAYSTNFNVPISSTFIDTFKYPYFSEGNSNICDSFGNLILCTNGYTVYDNHLNVIDGGDTVVPSQLCIREGGWSFYSQSSIFLPFDNKKYYLVTPTASDSIVINGWNNPVQQNATFDLLLYDVIDMNINAGAGKVTRKMVPLLDHVTLSKTQMMACRHSDGKDWWLLKQAWGSNTVYKFLFRQDTVIGPTIQSFASPQFNSFDGSGQSVFSRDGTKYATINRGAQQIFIADFDRCLGTLSNPKVFSVPIQKFALDTNQNDLTNGLAFSPNGRFIYVNGFSYIQQMDLQAPNPDTSWVRVAGPDTALSQFQQYACLYLGPDDKLYVGNWNGFSDAMSVFNNPDSKGLASNFCPKCLRFPTYYHNGQSYNGVSSPPCMPNYHLGPTNPICWVVNVEELKHETPTCNIYPNPTTTAVTIKYSHGGAFDLYDLTGKLITSYLLPQDTDTKILDISGLTPGVYLYRYSSGNFQSSGRLSVL